MYNAFAGDVRVYFRKSIRVPHVCITLSCQHVHMPWHFRELKAVLWSVGPCGGELLEPPPDNNSNTKTAMDFQNRVVGFSQGAISTPASTRRELDGESREINSVVEVSLVTQSQMPTEGNGYESWHWKR